MVVKTELCSFSEWKIYPGKGIRFVAKDGRPFLFLSKRTRNFGLRYLQVHAESWKPRDSDGPPPGEDSTRRSNRLKPERSRERETINKKKREPSRVLLLKLSISLRTPRLRTKRLWLRKQSERSRRGRKPRSLRDKETKRLWTRRNRMPRRLKTRPPRRPKRRLLQKPRVNDLVVWISSLFTHFYCFLQIFCLTATINGPLDSFILW